MAIVRRTCIHAWLSLQDLQTVSNVADQAGTTFSSSRVCHAKHPDSSRAEVVDQLVRLGTMADEGQKAGFSLQSTGHNEAKQDNQSEVAEKFSTTEEACTAQDVVHGTGEGIALKLCQCTKLGSLVSVACTCTTVRSSSKAAHLVHPHAVAPISKQFVSTMTGTYQ